MSPYLRDKNGIRLAFKGINTRAPWDEMPPGKYPYAQNVRANLALTAIGRPQQSTPITTATDASIQNITNITNPTTVPFLLLKQPGLLGVAIGAGYATIATGLSDNPVSICPCRPTSSPAAWGYVADSLKMLKVGPVGNSYSGYTLESYGMGIAEPQTVACIPTATASGSGNLTGTYVWFYKYRSSQTGAVSNQSPQSNQLTVSSQEVTLTGLASPDPQVDTLDWYRQSVTGAGLINPTYVGSSSPGVGFIDNLNDLAVADNPIMSYADFQPFPSIDNPTQGQCAYNSSTNILTASLGPFNVRWLPGSEILLVNQSNPEITAVALLVIRPTSTSSALVTVEGTLPTGNYNYFVYAATLAAQPMASMFGPTDNGLFLFAVGDPLRPGTLYWTEGNYPDSAPDTNQTDLTSPAEPLMNGVIVGGLGMVFSTERAWLIFPNFFSAVATVTGVLGNQWYPYESISTRGLYAQFGICTDGGGNVYFISKDGVYVSPGGYGCKSITDDDLYNLFPHEGSVPADIVVGDFTLYAPDFTKSASLRLSFADGFLFFDYIDTHGTPRTLVYDPIISGWCPDTYQFPVTIHAQIVGSGYMQGEFDVLIPAGLYVGDTTGHVRTLTTVSPAETTSTLVLTTTCFNAGEARSQKLFGDIFVDALIPNPGSAGQMTVLVWADFFTTVASNTSTIESIGPGRNSYIIDLPQANSAYDANSYRNIEIEFSWPLSQGIELFVWQPSLLELPENIQFRATDWDDGEYAGAKFVQGVIVEADTFGQAKNIVIEDDLLGTHTLNEDFSFLGRSTHAFSVTPFVAHLMRLVPQDSLQWRLFKFNWVYVPYPELCLNWETEGLTLGGVGWQHIPELSICAVSTSPISLVLTFDYGNPVRVTVPSTGGVQLKQWFKVAPNKFKVVSFQATSTAAFRLFLNDCDVRCGEWGRSDAYRTLRPFGGLTKAAAMV